MPFNLNTQEDVAVLQSALITMGYLDPPADGGWGPTSKWAMRAFCQAYAISYDENIITPGMAAALEHAPPLPVNADADNKLACRIARAMLKRNYWIARHWRCVNIAYVEGTGTDTQSDTWADMTSACRKSAGSTPSMTCGWCSPSARTASPSWSTAGRPPSGRAGTGRCIR